MAFGHTFENILEVGVGLYIVESGGFDQGDEGRPPCRAAIGTGEEMVLSSESHGPDGALQGGVVEVDAPIFNGLPRTSGPTRLLESDAFGCPVGPPGAKRRADRQGLAVSPAEETDDTRTSDGRRRRNSRHSPAP